MATKKVKIKLQGHEKFALREGWINKALMILPENPDAFTRKDATDLFGIGSNMVKSLRYWMRALGLTNFSGTELSEIGKLIAKYDPYVEKNFTLWLLHSYLAKNAENATTWYIFFNKCDVEDMDKEEIENSLLREIKKYAIGITFSEKSLFNDTDVLLNMYSRSKEKLDPEDNNISPFSRLELVKKNEGKYSKKHPSTNIVPDEMILYELARVFEEKDNVSIDELIYGDKGLARIYNMSSITANNIFERLDATENIRVNRTAGLDIIYSIKKLNPTQIIEEYYQKVKG